MIAYSVYSVYRLDELKEKLKRKFTQWRICEKFEPRVVESNFMVCLKRMFNRNYQPKTECWWVGRCITDVPGIKEFVIFTLHNLEIGFIDVFVKYTSNPMSLRIYILLKDYKYIEIDYD